MTQKALKKMYQLLLTEPHAPTVCAQLERIAREALAEHAMQEVQRLGQEIEQEPVAMRMPKVGDDVVCIEDESLGEVAYLTAGGSPEIKFDDGSHGTYLLREFAELFRYATPPQRTWVGLENAEAGWFCHTDFLNARKYTKKQREYICNQLLSEAQSWDIDQYTRMMHDSTKRPFIGLTDEEMKKIWYAMQNIMGWYSFQEIARAIEAAHGIRENT